jgi:hypothetical protein
MSEPAAPWTSLFPTETQLKCLKHEWDYRERHEAGYTLRECRRCGVVHSWNWSTCPLCLKTGTTTDYENHNGANCCYDCSPEGRRDKEMYEHGERCKSVVLWRGRSRYYCVKCGIVIKAAL